MRRSLGLRCAAAAKGAAQDGGAKKGARRATDWAGVAIFGTMSAVTFGLGSWQLTRYNWKLDLVEERRRKLREAPVPLGESSLEPYERVVCRGTFDYAESMLVGPRGPPKGAGDAGGAMAPSGYFVVTPFTESGTGRKVLINRGWIPRTRRDLAFVQEVDGVVELEGVIGVAEKGGAFTPDHKAGEQVDFFAMDAAVLGAVKGLPDGTVLVERLGGAGPLVPKTIDSMQTFKVHPSTHIGYAATWYGLCATGLFVIKKRFFR